MTATAVMSYKCLLPQVTNASSNFPSANGAFPPVGLWWSLAGLVVRHPAKAFGGAIASRWDWASNWPLLRSGEVRSCDAFLHVANKIGA